MCCSYDSDHEDTEGPERPFRMKRRVGRQRLCGVCGDLAVCHNFGAVTCETCKAFFRRNANKPKPPLPCTQGGSCVITKATRRHCAACRLKKCYAIGMDRSLILNDDELKKRQRKLKEASERRQSKLPEQDAATSSTIFTTTPFPDLKAQDSPETSECSTTHRNKITGGVKRNEAAAESQIPSGSSPSWQVALGLTFRHIRREQKPTDSHLYCSLTGHETSLLEYLNRSYKEIFWSVTHPKGDGSFSVKDLPLERVMVAVDSMLRKFINFSKRVPEFRQLMEEDKATLLKSRSMNVYCVRLAEAYLPEERSKKRSKIYSH